MRKQALASLERDLKTFLDRTTAGMGRSERRHWAECYLRGLLLDGERKSVEPMAQRLNADVQGLQQFVGQSPWSAEQLLRALNAVAREELVPARYWVIDETSFPKQGKQSVGVARQYCGTLGKIANCQVAVSLHWSDAEVSWPMGWKLYLPPQWVEDAGLRRKAGIPKEIDYRSKPDLALELIGMALEQGHEAATILADQLYGNGFAWRAALQAQNLSYCVAVEADTGVWPHTVKMQPSGQGRPRKLPPREDIISLRERARRADGQSWSKLVWREGTKGPQESRFFFTAVWAANRAGRNSRIARWTEYALIEWPANAPEPTKYWLCWWKDRIPTLLELVQTAKSRWRVEMDYRELKEELGLDHFEGRGWTGWHHHAALVTMAYIFLRLQQHDSKKNFARHVADGSSPSHSATDPA